MAERLEALASRLRQETGIAIEIIQADLTQVTDLAKVETRLGDDARIGILVNNAGTALGVTFIDQSADDITKLVALMLGNLVNALPAERCRKLA